MKNITDQIPAVSNPKVTFVSGSAAFELDNTMMALRDLLPEIERKIGLKCSQVINERQHLGIVAPTQTFDQLKDLEGVISIERAEGGTTRITYNPYVVGARSLLSGGVHLAPPETNTGAAVERRRLLKTAWATGVAAVSTIPIVVLNWSENDIPHTIKAIVSLVLATAVQIIAVPEFYVGAIKDLVFSHVIEMDMLVAISITAAFGYSVCAFGLTKAGVDLKQEAFFETSSLLITLVLLGRLLAAFARTRAISAVSIHSMQVVSTLLVEPDGQAVALDARLLHFGDIMMIMPHTRIVTDGPVILGDSAVDESMVTGEGIPIEKRIGSTVIAGTINGSRVLDVKVSRLVGANTISDISGLVENALGAKPRVQDLADKVASWFIPIVVGIAIVVFTIWIAIAFSLRNKDASGAIGPAITYSVAVLAVLCPCALGLAVPMVLVIVGGVAATAGVVVKSADATERGFQVIDVVFEKTGTLTNKDLQVISEESVCNDLATREGCLRLLLSLIEGSDHPVSKAVSVRLESKS